LQLQTGIGIEPPGATETDAQVLTTAHDGPKIVKQNGVTFTLQFVLLVIWPCVENDAAIKTSIAKIRFFIF
jgi:hypothetical protein